MTRANYHGKSHDTPPAAKDHRSQKREPMLGITAMVRSERGVLHEGVVQDVSNGGLGISGDASGLCMGDKVEIVVVIQGQHVGYHGEIRHIDIENRFYGVHFESGPHRGEQKHEATKTCRQCRKDSPDEHTFCFRCGQRLVGGHRGPNREPTSSKALPN